MSGDQEVEVTAVCKVRESRDAVLYLVHRTGGGHTPTEVWVPKSTIVAVDGTEVEDLEDGEWGDTSEPVALTLKRWLAEREELV